MAEPEADGCDVDEAQEAFGSFVVASGNASGILQLVEAPLDEVAQFVESAINCDVQLSGFSHGYHWYDVACFHGFAKVVRVMAAVCQKDARFGKVVAHDQIKAQIVRCLPLRDVCPGVMSALA